ncbi:MAG TPA: hypothetical protein VG053_01365 [Solirubrobacteraceae bacterium]|nr:hypothetical protein [Solirubrobacteraceae bacterium]
MTLGVLGDLRSDAAQAVLLLGELRGLTKWGDERLCGQLNCDLDKWTQAGSAGARGEAALNHSLLFLTLVRDATQLVDLTADRREVVNAAVELCHAAGGPVAKRAPRMRAALEHTPTGDLRPLDLLGLGEIGRAWRSTALNMESGPAYEQAVAAMRLAGSVAAQTAHLSPERLLLLAGSKPKDLLGRNVSQRMAEHLLFCNKCKKLAESMDLHDLLRSEELLDLDALSRPVAA